MASELFDRQYNKLIDSMRIVQFGNPIVAGIGGSSAQFRWSDDVGYVSKILTEKPSSIFDEFGDEVNVLREHLGLKPLSPEEMVPTEAGYEDGVINIGDMNMTPEQFNPNQLGESSGSWLPDLSGYIRSYAFWTLGIGLVLVGLIVVAMESKTVKDVAATAAKAAV